MNSKLLLTTAFIASFVVAAPAMANTTITFDSVPSSGNTN